MSTTIEFSNDDRNGQHNVLGRKLRDAQVRVLADVKNNRVKRTNKFEYISINSGHNISRSIYALEETGYLTLDIHGGIFLTERGVKKVNEYYASIELQGNTISKADYDSKVGISEKDTLK